MKNQIILALVIILSSYGLRSQSLSNLNVTTLITESPELSGELTEAQKAAALTQIKFQPTILVNSTGVVKKIRVVLTDRDNQEVFNQDLNLDGSMLPSGVHISKLDNTWKLELPSFDNFIEFKLVASPIDAQGNIGTAVEYQQTEIASTPVQIQLN